MHPRTQSRRGPGPGLLAAGFLITLLLLTAPPGAAGPAVDRFSKGPYLQAPGTDTMTVLWESPDRLPARVRYGEGGRCDRVIEANPPRELLAVSTRYRTNVVAGVSTNVTSYTVTNRVQVYTVPLNGLRSDTVHSYRVELGSQTSPKRSFRTFGESPETVRFIAYGDSRSRPEVHAAVARRFGKHKPDFILHTGDLVARGRDYSLWAREFFQPLAKVIDRVPLLPAIGNHEEDGTNYFAYFHLPAPERWYSFDLGPVHVLALDYHFEAASHEQFAFAQADLRRSRAPWKVIFLHYPMFNIGGHATTWGHTSYLPLFHETGVDLVLSGHSHLYERFRPVMPRKGGPASPIIHLTTGGGGANLYPVYDHPALATKASTNHFVLLTATRDRLRGEAFLPSGQVIDRFELSKRDGKPAAEQVATSYPEEWLRAYFEAASVLRGRVLGLPTTNEAAVVQWTLKPLTNVVGPVEFELRLPPDVATAYEWVGPPLVVSAPKPGEPDRVVEARVRATGRKPISGRVGQDMSPALVFEARMRSDALDVAVRSVRASVGERPKPRQ